MRRDLEYLLYLKSNDSLSNKGSVTRTFSAPLQTRQMNLKAEFRKTLADSLETNPLRSCLPGGPNVLAISGYYCKARPYGSTFFNLADLEKLARFWLSGGAIPFKLKYQVLRFTLPPRLPILPSSNSRGIGYGVDPHLFNIASRFGKIFLLW